MWKFIAVVVHDYDRSLQPDLAEGFYTSPTCSCYIAYGFLFVFASDGHGVHFI